MKKILIAARELHGGTEKGGPAVLNAGEELTTEAQKALGLKKDDVDALVAAGTLSEVNAREAGGGNDASLAAANKRADDAEAQVAELTKQVETLTAELAEATKPKA